MKKPYELIIFDWDGTLIDSIDWIVSCLQYAASACQYPVPESQAAKNIIGLSIENAMQSLFPNADSEMRQRMIKLYSQRFFSRQITDEDLFEGVYQMLENFTHAGYKLAVATGKKNAGLVDAMKRTGVEHFFVTTRSADQTASKPDPLMINEIVTELGVSKNKTLMVGDSAHDMQMAKNAEVAAVAVACGAHDDDILKQYDPLFCLQQTSHLINLIQ